MLREDGFRELFNTSAARMPGNHVFLLFPNDPIDFAICSTANHSITLPFFGLLRNVCFPHSVGFTFFKFAIGYTTGACKTGAAELGTLQQIVVAYKRLAETCPDRKIRTYHRGVLSDIQVTYAATGPGCVRLGLQHMPQQTLTEK